MKPAAWRIVVCLGLVAAAPIAATSTFAAPKPSCEGTKWSVERDAELIRSPNRPSVASGGSAVLAQAYTVDLVDLPSAKLPQPPGKAPKQKPSKAGFVQVAAPPQAGTIQVSVSDPVWIDLVQNGRLVRSTAFSGSHDCADVHKSVRFTVEAAPFSVQVSGTQADRTTLVILQVP